jgi:hypothetical protein
MLNNSQLFKKNYCASIIFFSSTNLSEMQLPLGCLI